MPLTMPVHSAFVLALDQGTTSSRAIAFDRNAQILASAQQEFAQHFPQPGWVEHDANEICATQRATAQAALADASLSGKTIAAIGITNQRETTVIWNRETGEPLAPAIVWQDRRTAAFCASLRDNAREAEEIKSKTGLVIDAYFSASKLKWLLDNVPGARECAERDQLAFGTIDSWLLFKLTLGKVHATDVSNASRTMLFNIHTLDWDDALLARFDIPRSVLPKIVSSSGVVGHTACEGLPVGIPIAGMAGDQQAALFGQACHRAGMAKNTYGTGCFVLMNAGPTPPTAETSVLLTTVAWRVGGTAGGKADNTTHYALEGSVFIAGAAVQWLRDGLGIIKDASEMEALASSVASSEGVTFVPAFAGLGTPYWDMSARGTITGLTRGSTRAHIARATLEAIAMQSADLVTAMSSHLSLAELRVDGGASRNNLLMQIQADVLGVNVVRPRVTETTALGAAYLAGLAVGVWDDLDDIAQHWAVDTAWSPGIDAATRDQRMRVWHDAVQRSRGQAQRD
jgi:glycerol kinase